MAARTVVDGVAGHLLRRRRCGASQLSNLLRRMHGTNAGATRPGPSTLLPDEVIDVKPRAVAPSEQLNKTESGAVTVAAEDAANETYWAPDPETGVFTPDNENGGVDDYSSAGIAPRATAAGDEPSVLEQTAWIRELEVEEAEKPPP